MRAAWPSAVLALASDLSGHAAAQIVSVALQGPDRDFGRFAGDLLTSTAIVIVQPGTVLDKRSLPPVGPASAIAELRQVVVAGTPTRIEIRVTYQSFFSPDQVTQADMPGYTVIFSAHGARLAAAVPGFAFTASPFRHDLQPSLDPATMRPDHPPSRARTPNVAWAITAGAALMAVGLLALIGPWRIRSRRRPFAAAAAQLSQAALAPSDDGDYGREALRVLHRAFDATAGRRVFAEDIDDVLKHHPCLKPMRDRIETFFAASRHVFFDENGQAPQAAPWVRLCRDLARAERRG